jgi:hypothetical protein
MKVQFVSSDNKVFESKEDCIKYEESSLFKLCAVCTNYSSGSSFADFSKKNKIRVIMKRSFYDARRENIIYIVEYKGSFFFIPGYIIHYLYKDSGLRIDTEDICEIR